jgi:anti-sigma regulatory factor (Ser/Thr protein kinase)
VVRGLCRKTGSQATGDLSKRGTTVVNQHCSMQLSRSLTEIVRARRWLSDQLDAQGWVTVDQQRDALVMVSELVTNALEHTTSAASVEVTRTAEGLRVGVHDDGVGWPSIVPSPSPRASGNGLRIVAAWSAAWGVHSDPAGGKTVWFSIPG